MTSGSAAAEMLHIAPLKNWDDSYEKEALELLKQYIQINTVNPPGDVRQAAEFLKGICDKEGIPYKTGGPQPDKHSLLAKIKGTGEKKPVAFINHIDVVPVDENMWSVDPFAGVIKDGYLYGRGTIDMKCVGIFQLMALIYLARNKITPSRDIYFLACPDEEIGGKLGAEWAAANWEELQNLEAVFNEGGGIIDEKDGSISHIAIDNCEKIMLTIKIAFQGTPGHASMPVPDNCNVRLVEALHRLNLWKQPVEISPSVKEYFQVLSQIKDDPLHKGMADLDNSLKDPHYYSLFTEDPRNLALVSNTMSLTILQAGSKSNVIPNKAEAVIDFRLLPGTCKKSFIEKIRQIIEDPSAEISIGKESAAALESSIDSYCYKVLKGVYEAEFPGIPAAPSMMVAVTDSRFFRALGIDSYGFNPISMGKSSMGLMHSNDERISIADVYRGTRLTAHAALELSK